MFPITFLLWTGILSCTAEGVNEVIVLLSVGTHYVVSGPVVVLSQLTHKIDVTLVLETLDRSFSFSKVYYEM